MIKKKRSNYSFASAQQSALVNQKSQLKLQENKYLTRFDQMHSPSNMIKQQSNEVPRINLNMPARLSQLSIAANERKMNTMMEMNLLSTQRLHQAQSSRPSSFFPQSIASIDHRKMKNKYLTGDSKILQSLMLLDKKQVKRPCDKTLRSSKLYQRQTFSEIDLKYKLNGVASDVQTPSLKTKVMLKTKNIQVFQKLKIKARPGPGNPGQGNFFFRNESEDILSHLSPKSETNYSPQPASHSKISLKLFNKPLHSFRKPQTAQKKQLPVNNWSKDRMMINKLNLYEDKAPRSFIQSYTTVSTAPNAIPNYHTSRGFTKNVQTTLNYL